MFARALLAIFTSLKLLPAAEITAAEIMARVAENQDKAMELRQQYIYHEHVAVATRHFNGKLARQEQSELDVTPGAKAIDKKMTAIHGTYEKKGRYLKFDSEPIPCSETLDGGLVKSFREDLLNAKDKDGVGHDLFPLTTEEQKQYKFEVLGTKQVEGRDAYQIGFSPADSHDITWAGEALIDKEELQPIRVFTKLSRKLPLGVRVLLGTDVPGIGFNVQYVRVEKDVWFPKTFGSEFRLKAVFFIKRDITISMEANSFRRATADSTVTYKEQ